MRKFILPLLSTTLGSGGMYYVTFFLSPYNMGGSLNFGNLALLLICALALLAPILGLLVYYASLLLARILKNTIWGWQIKVSRAASFKRGTLLALFIVTLGTLQATKTNSLFNIILLILILGLLETYSWKRVYGKK